MIIVKANLFMKAQDLDRMQKHILDQKKDGVIVLPAGFEVIVVDGDEDIEFKFLGGVK